MQGVAKMNYPSHVLGLTAMTGTSQAWFLEGHHTFASIAESLAALDKPSSAPWMQPTRNCGPAGLLGTEAREDDESAGQDAYQSQ
jgi:hypothetical protein